MAAYTFDNAWIQARQRLACIEAISDEGTIRQLTARGVGVGWRCLEVGGGGGTIAAWLSNQVGSSGQVVATDIDTRFLEALELPNLEVQRHDLLKDDLPLPAFDLVHTRAVICHLPDPGRALDSLVGALAPGGCLVVEEPDYVSLIQVAGMEPRSAELFQKVMDARLTFLASRGFDRYYGRRLYGELRARGLMDVASEGHVSTAGGGSPWAEFFQLGTRQIQEHLTANGEVTLAEVEAFYAMLDDPGIVIMTPIVVAAWGRKPHQ